MKLIFILLLICSFSVSGQNVKRDSNGNYITISVDKAPPIKTKYFYKDSKGLIYPVYENSKGKRYVNKVSKKTGEPYKVYLIE